MGIRDNWKYWMVVLLWWGVASTAQAMPADSALLYAQKALEWQQNGQVQKAIQQYEQVLEQGYQSAELYNNLGLAYAKTGQLGLAIVRWERALQLAPLYAEAQHNLKAAQQDIERPITATPPIALVRGWRSIHQQWTAVGWGILFLLLWVAAVGCIGYAWNKDRKVWREHTGVKLAVGLLVLSLLPLSWGLSQQAQEQERGRAIIIAKQAGLRPYPELSSEEMEVLSEGVRVQLLEEQGEWVKVELPNYLVGWVPKSLLEQI